MFYFIALALLASTHVAAYDQCFSLVDTSVSKGWQQYGSQLLCSEACSGYAYVALMNGGACYCLSLLPSSLSQASSSQCSVACLGWPSVMCGGQNAYTVFDNSVSGGSGDSGSGTTLAGTQNTQTTQTTLLKSLTSTGSSSSSSSSNSRTGTQATTTTPSPGTSSSLTAQGDVTHIITSSIGTATASDGSNSVQYKTITATSGPSSSATASPSASATPSSTGKKSSTSIAPIVGGVVGGVAAIALALVIFFFVRRRNAREEDDEEDFFKKTAPGGAGGVSRAKSNKFNSVFDMPMANPFEHPSDEKRASTNLGGLTDPRLNPVMMGRRRLSEGSLADETDYSRKILGVANP